MSKITKITGIMLKIGEKEIQLTPEEAKDLKRALDEMYPSYPPQPLVIEKHYPRWWERPSYWGWSSTIGGLTNMAEASQGYAASKSGISLLCKSE